MGENKEKNKKRSLKSIFSKKKQNIEANYGPIVVEQLNEIKKSSLNNKNEIGSNRNPFKFEPNSKYFTICVYAIGTIAVAAFVIYTIMHIGTITKAIGNFMSVLSTFIAAFFIAFILNPMVNWFNSCIFEKRFKLSNPKTRKMLSIAVSYLLVIGLIVIAIIYVIPQITESVTQFIKQSEGIYREAMEFISNIEDRFPNIDFGLVEEKLESFWPELINYASSFVKDIVPRIFNMGVYIAKAAINVLLSIAISIYMLYDKRDLSKNLTKLVYALFPVKKASSATATIKECGSIFTNFVVGKAIDSLIIGILCYFILIILGLDYAILLAVIVGVTNMIPYFGPFIGAVPGVLLFICINPVDALIFAIAILALQQFDGWILGPKILGDSTGLTPLWVIFGITVGGAYGGVVGMFLGVPVVAVVSFLLSKFINGELAKKNVKVK